MRPECKVLGAFRINLSSGENLNDYKSEGKYRATSMSVANTIENNPSGNAFVLDVFNGTNSVIQWLIPFSVNAFDMRRYQVSTGTWTEWKVYSCDVTT